MKAADHLSKNLRALRELRGLPQTEFAKEIGISKSTLQDIEQGHSPTLETVDCIAGHLGLPVCALLSEDLSAGEMSVLVELFRHSAWFASWPRPDQVRFLELSRQLAQLVETHI